MTDYAGPWQGSTPRARIVFKNATHVYNADQTAAYVSGTAGIEFENDISDSSNSWSFAWPDGTAGGSNVSYQDPGFRGLVDFGAWRYTRITNLSCTVTGLEGVGATVTYSMDYSAPTAPYLNGTQVATSITSTSAVISNLVVASDGGGTMVDVQAQTNTSPTDVGATLFQTGAWANIPVSRLPRYTTIYYRVRVANNTYGWGPWSAWKSFQTLAVVPTMGTAYSAGSLTRNSAIIRGLSVTDNGGQAPVDVRVQYNTSATDVGASVVTQGSWKNVAVSGLAALTTYHYRCAAYNSAGWSAYGPWKSFTTLSDAPSDMAAPTFSSVTDTSMRASWVAPAMNGATFVAYRYEVSLVDTFASLVTSGTTAALFIDLTDLIPGTRYYVRVRANATPNNGGYGVANQLTTGFAPNSGLRVYAFIDGVREQGELYTFIGGVRKKLTPMYAHDGVVETE